MKIFYTIIAFLLFYIPARSQNVSLNDLVSFTAYTPARFENSVSKKGFRTAGFNQNAESQTYTWRTKKKEESAHRSIFKSDKEDKATVAFETTSEAEFTTLREQLKTEGYRFTEGAATELYQKGSLTVKPVSRAEGEKTVYSFIVERKALPKAKDLVFAEDFLQLTSHEYLASVFGEANVKRDQFYFSEKEVNKCSVLFPNTSMQVIFIWNDEQNLRDPAFLLVGGQLQAQSSAQYHKQIEQNVWQSRQGIYSGMTLRELQRLNTTSISVHGWQSKQPGVVAAENNGHLDFKNLNLVLNCLDCNEDTYYTKNEILNSENLLREGRRVYVSSIILLPKGK